MKKMFVLLLSAILFVSGCSSTNDIKNESQKANRETEFTTEESSKPKFESEISSEKCYLCGDHSKSVLQIYNEQNNIGIIDLNTFDISPISINRYDDYGHLIEEPDNHTSTTTSSYGEKGMFTVCTPNSNRGYANASVSFTDDKELDFHALQEMLCTDCMNKILEKTWQENPYAIGLINFETLDVKLFEESVSGFSFGDYYVDVTPREKQSKDDLTELDLLIFYCPPRYE